MTKFIACEDGSYINLNNINFFYMRRSNNDNWEVFIYHGEAEDVLCSSLSSRDKAQEWLDKFMEKHGLLLEPTTPSRCF